MTAVERDAAWAGARTPGRLAGLTGHGPFGVLLVVGSALRFATAPSAAGPHVAWLVTGALSYALLLRWAKLWRMKKTKRSARR